MSNDVNALLQQEYQWMAAYQNQAAVANYNLACSNAALNGKPNPAPPMLVKVVPVGQGAFATFELAPDKLYVPPVPVVKPTVKSAVGVHIGMTNNFAYVPGVIPEPKVGDTYTKDPRGKFVCVQNTPTPFGPEIYWGPVTAAKPSNSVKTK